ncbi:MAG: hypothetical protein J6W40_03880 [Alphaproteobacteria bacterium]|nr:hypothetical protein [Alphaproteobacteria bacterium]
MKKILCAFLLVIVSVVGARSDDLGYISEAGSTYDVLQSEVCAGAIRGAFSDLMCDCGRLSTETKNEILHNISSSTLGHFSNRESGLRLVAIFSILENILGYENEQTLVPQKCLSCIIKHHNKIVQDEERIKQERQSAEWQKGKVFTSEQEYNDTLRAKGKCLNRNTSSVMFSSTIKTRKGCEKYCKNVAIKDACYIEATLFDDGKHEYSEEEGETRCSCNSAYEGNQIGDRMEQEWFKDYFFMPTWEDYKKLYNIK